MGRARKRWWKHCSCKCYLPSNSGGQQGAEKVAERGKIIDGVGAGGAGQWVLSLLRHFLSLNLAGRGGRIRKKNLQWCISKETDVRNGNHIRCPLT